jgi:hypothetical protein
MNDYGKAVRRAILSLAVFLLLLAAVTGILQNELRDPVDAV